MNRRKLIRRFVAVSTINSLSGCVDPVSNKDSGNYDPIKSLCENQDTLCSENKNFIIINNKWGTNSSNQCVHKYGDNTYGWTWDRKSTESNDPNYPQILKGTKPWGTYSTNKDMLPIQFSEIEDFECGLDVEQDNSGGEWNLMLEWWITGREPVKGSDVSNSISDEVMVVLDSSEDHSHGNPIESNAVTDSYGNVIDYWKKYESEWNLHIFRIKQQSVPENIDLLYLIEYLSENIGSVSDDLWMGSVELGNENWDHTSGSTRINSFSLTLNRETVSLGE